MDINSFCCAENKIWLGKVCSCNFCRILHSTENKDNFQPRRFKRAKLRGLWACWLVDPSFRQNCLERGNLCEQEESVGQSERLCCLRTNATRGTDPWNWGNVGQGVSVMMSCLRLTKGNTFCRCEHLFADVMYFTGDKVPTGLPAKCGLLNVLHLQQPGPKALRFIKFPMFKNAFHGHCKANEGIEAAEQRLSEIVACFN